MSKDSTYVTKNVKFEFYHVFKVSTNNGKLKEELFDLLEWIEIMSEFKSNEERTVAYNLDNIRVDNIENDERGVCLLHFSRLRESHYPSIADFSTNETRDISISDNEYLSEDINLLYDPTIRVLMIQRNINSLSPTAVNDYISYFWEEKYQGEKIELRPILEKNPFQEAMEKDNFRKITIKTSEFRSFNNDSRFDKLASLNPFKQAFNALEVYNSVDIEISLSVGRSRNNELSYTDTKNAIAELEKVNKSFDKIIISGKNDDDTPVEKMDLLKGKVDYVEPFEIPLRKSLSADLVKKRMIKIYLDGTEPMQKRARENL